MKYIATLYGAHGSLKSADPLYDGYRAIIEANYNYAKEKYGEGFDVTRVEEYQCVLIARSVLATVGLKVKVEEI